MYNFTIFKTNGTNVSGQCNDVSNSLKRLDVGEKMGTLGQNLILSIINTNSYDIEYYKDLFDSDIDSIVLTSTDSESGEETSMVFKDYSLNRIERRFTGLKDTILIDFNK